jgi:biotin carboxyl carrier protein
MPTYRVRANGREYSASVVDRPGGGATVTIDGESFEVESVALASSSPSAPTAAPQVIAQGPAPGAGAPVALAAPGAVVAPIPGKIIAVKVKVGDTVRAHQVLAVLEAMKMENNVPSPTDGTVKEIAVSEGSEVSTGQTLMVIE